MAFVIPSVIVGFLQPFSGTSNCRISQCVNGRAVMSSGIGSARVELSLDLCLVSDLADAQLIQCALVPCKILVCICLLTDSLLKVQKSMLPNSCTLDLASFRHGESKCCSRLIGFVCQFLQQVYDNCYIKCRRWPHRGPRRQITYQSGREPTKSVCQTQPSNRSPSVVSAWLG